MPANNNTSGFMSFGDSEPIPVHDVQFHLPKLGDPWPECQCYGGNFDLQITEYVIHSGDRASGRIAIGSHKFDFSGSRDDFERWRKRMARCRAKYERRMKHQK